MVYGGNGKGAGGDGALYAMLRKARPIGLAALVDIVFLLLIFFMVASVFSEESMLYVESAEKTGQSGAQDAITFVLDEQGRLFYDGVLHTSQQADDVVRRHVAQNPDTRFHVETANETHVQDTVSLMDILEKAGARHVRMTLSQPPSAP